MTRHRILLVGALSLAGVPALAQTTTGYGPSLQAPDQNTPLAAEADQPSGPASITPGITRPSAVVTSGATATLSDALSEVYLTDPTLLGERARLRATDENVPSALSGWRPQVSFTAAAGYDAGAYSIGPTSPYNSMPQLDRSTKFSNDHPLLTEQLNLSQPLYRGGRTTSATAQAENQVRAERARLLAQEEQSFSTAISAFVTVIEDQQLYALQVSNVQVLTKTLQATNARFSVGEITRTDVAQAQAALAGAIAQRETAFGTLQTARATYRQVIGDLPDRLIEPQPLALPITSAEQADTLAALNNPSVIAAAYDDAQAKDAVDVAFANLMPQVSFQGVGSYQDDAAQRNERSLGAMFTANLTVPIYQGGQEYAAIRQAKQNEQQSRKAIDIARRMAVQTATQYWEQFVAAKATVASTRAQVRADEVALDGVEREALAGTQTTLDVLNAEQLLVSARVTLVQNLAVLVSDSYQVAGTVGRLTARDLGLKVPLYDETAYYHSVRNAAGGTDDHATAQPGR